MGKTVSESAVLTKVRLTASNAGWRVWRNNRGAGKLTNGSFVRWGLCNDSPALGAHVRSADLIGVRPIVITQAMVGTTIGQFVSIEVKRPGWTPSPGDEHEQGQRRWADMVNALGGYAIFSTGGI